MWKSRNRLRLRGRPELTTKNFDNVKNQIGFCGIWCGSCLGGSGAVQELTRKYEQIVKHSQRTLEKWAPKEFDYNATMKSLASIKAMPLCTGRKKGGGDPSCKVRTCASKRNMANCSECNELMKCKNFEDLEKGYPKIKKKLTKIKNANQKEITKKWMSELKTKWPHCVLICETTNK